MIRESTCQIRELDAHIKWEEIENSSHLAKMDKESIKSMRSFKKAIIRRKSSEGGGRVKYLLDFGKRRFIPDAVVKHGSKIDDPSSSERKKYWVEEPYVPLFLLKPFEDKRIALKSNKTSTSFPVSSRVVKNPSKKDVFSYLFSKAEKPENHLCGHCNKDVLIRYFAVTSTDPLLYEWIKLFCYEHDNWGCVLFETGHKNCLEGELVLIFRNSLSNTIWFYITFK